MELPWMNGRPGPQSGRPGPQPGQQGGTGTDAFVMGSRFELRSRWRSPAFLLLSMRIWRQARRTPGLLGVSLRAHPVSGVFWTLSAWADEPALREFARTDPHRTIMKKARSWTKSSTFRFWTVPADELSPGPLWADAQTRIAALPRTGVQAIVPDRGPLQ
jgi:heme-degrading monooxygenase HmoA